MWKRSISYRSYISKTNAHNVYSLATVTIESVPNSNVLYPATKDWCVATFYGWTV